MTDPNGRAWGILFARLTLGLMFFQGAWWRVFGIGPAEHARRFFVEPYAETALPTWSLWAVGASIPFVELVCGALVVVGLWRLPALIGLGFVLVTVTFGHFLAEPLFSISGHVFPRLALVVFLLVMPSEWDRLSVDGWRSDPEGA